MHKLNPYTCSILDNSMMIGHEEMGQDISTVSVSVLINTGSKFEKKGQSGISHFLEHMAFKGTTTRDAKQIAEAFDMIGGYFNAYTSRERTAYYAKVMKEDLETAIDILSDIVQYSVFPEDEIEKERKVVLQEIAETNDTPDDIIFDHFQEAAFPDQSIGRSVLGREEVIMSITRDQILEYVKDRYGFNNTIVAAAGNCNADLFYDLALPRFKNLPGERSLNTKIVSRYEGGESRVKKDLEQVHCVLGFQGASYHDQDFYTQKVVATILGGGMSSRLFQEVREKRGLAYTISAFGSSFSDTGLFGIYSSCNENDINELLDVAIEQLLDMMHNVTEEEFTRSKKQITTGLLMSRESSLARVEKLANDLAIYGEYRKVEENLQRLALVDRDKVKGFVKKMLSNSKRPTISSIGKIDKLYQYDIIQNKLKI